MKVAEHDHPLQLVDLLVNNEDVEDSDEEEKELLIQNEFVSNCKRCSLKIHVYHRYYYKCIYESCDYPLHKSCAELPTTLKHTLHPHPLTLKTNYPYDWECSNCESQHKAYDVFYECCMSCDFCIDVDCAVEGLDKRRIYHPSHPHPLVSLISQLISCECNGCWKEHMGVFFLCTICPNFALHTRCAFLPKTLLIQKSVDDIFHHTHPLVLSYSFPNEERSAKYYPKCRVCDNDFLYDKEPFFIYKCEKCIYYAHVDCATTERWPFFFSGKRRIEKNYKDADYPDLLHLPFRDQTFSIPRKLFFKETGFANYGIDEVSLRHINHHHHHQHKLVLVDTEYTDALGGPTSSQINSSIMCHNPMKKIELLCNGCVRPIMEIPFYKCEANKDESCNYAVHEWCTRLPTKVDNHIGHPQHSLVLMSNVSHVFFNIFNCEVCLLPCNGYAYGCVKCEYYVDVTCGLMPEEITHKSHPNHLLRLKRIPTLNKCLMCQQSIYRGQDFQSKTDLLGFNCDDCRDVHIHTECALLLPETIRHAYDKHPMHLSYLPIENHKSEYFCEICEHRLNPHKSFYHCDECAQSVHCACAPLILRCETETYSLEKSNIYWFSNVKFGGIHKTNVHPHPLSFAQGIENDGRCNMCRNKLQYKMIFKCLKCKYAIDYECCKSLYNS